MYLRMVNDLFRAASRFHKLSQDPMAPIKAAVEAALLEHFPGASFKTISVIGNEVKIAVHLEPSMANSAVTATRSQIQSVLAAEVAKINPSLKTTVTIDLSSESTVVQASRRKTSQDQMEAIRAAVFKAAESVPNVTVKTVNMFGNEVKIDVDITEAASAGARTMLTSLFTPAVQKVNPSLQVNVIVSMSTETIMGNKTARLRRNFAKFHKLAECAQGDPLCDGGLDPTVKPDVPKPAKYVPKPTPKPIKPLTKEEIEKAEKDKNKVDDGTDALPADITAALDSAVQGVKGSLRLEVNGKSVTVRYNSERIKAGPNKVKEVINSALMPLGYQVVGCIGETNVIPNYINAL